MRDERRRELRVVVVLACAVSITAFAWYFAHSELLLYGDAVAHINIARRVFDSRSPGPLQLGTVWLPLPHVAMIPFLVNDWMWRTGVGGAIPSMIAYVLGVTGMFRLVRARMPAYVAWSAAALYGLNPNLLYMQSTAMNEPLMMAVSVWALVYLDELKRSLVMQDEAEQVTMLPPHKAIERCGIVLAAGILTRYDGWILAAAAGAAVVSLLWRGRESVALKSEWRRVRRSTIAFFALCALVPTLWLAQNYAISARPLDFINGPYSAKAIEEHTMKPGDVPHPGTHDVRLAALFYFQSAKLNVAPYRGSLLMILPVLLGTAAAIYFRRKYALWLLLWLPLPFYIYSIGWGSVPIFMPVWWPFSYYNVRYGLEMLPCFAVFAASGVGMFAQSRMSRPVRFTVVMTALIVLGSYVPAARETPICLREARVNSKSRVELERRLAEILGGLPRGSSILMFSGEYVGALQRSGIPLRQTVNETIHPAWDNAMSDPAGAAEYVVTVEGDAVWYAARLFPRRLEKITEFKVEGKPPVVVYRSVR